MSNDCEAQLPVCKAECCRQFMITNTHTQALKDFVPGAKIQFIKVLTNDQRRYYKLRGVVCGRGTMIVTLKDFEIRGNKVVIFRDCDGLTKDLTCRYHGTSSQPRVCAHPSLVDHKRRPGVYITEHCRYYDEE